MEWRPGEDLAQLRANVTTLVMGIADPFLSGLVEDIERAFDATYPGRAWFLGIEDTPGSWVQFYQPYRPSFIHEAIGADGKRLTAYPEVGCA